MPAFVPSAATSASGTTWTNTRNQDTLVALVLVVLTGPHIAPGLGPGLLSTNL